MEAKEVESESSPPEYYPVMLNHFHFTILAMVDTRTDTSSSVYNGIYCLWRSCRSICKINIQYCRATALCLCILTAQSLLRGSEPGQRRPISQECRSVTSLYWSFPDFKQSCRSCFSQTINMFEGSRIITTGNQHMTIWMMPDKSVNR